MYLMRFKSFAKAKKKRKIAETVIVAVAISWDRMITFISTGSSAFKLTSILTHTNISDITMLTVLIVRHLTV